MVRMGLGMAAAYVLCATIDCDARAMSMPILLDGGGYVRHRRGRFKRQARLQARGRR